MKLLALDTTMAACSVAVIDTDHELPLARNFVAMERGHAEALAPMVRQAMAEAGLGFTDLGRIAVTVGPGTFTGVRIGLAMARGLGLALGIPVTGIDTLTAIAANALPAASPILIAADARKDETYHAVVDGAGQVIRPPAVGPLDGAMQAVADGSLVIGTAADAVIAASGRSGLVRSRAGDLPNAAAFARLAAALPDPAAMPLPLYLRAPDAKPQAVPHNAGPVRFERLSAADADLLAALHAECFDNPWTAEDFRQLLAMPGGLAVAAAEGSEPVAFVLTRRAADEAEIVTIGTRPFARRRGAARQLLTRQFAELAAAGVRMAFIEVATSNAAARALYAALGFTEAGLRRSYYQRGNGYREDAVVMRKDLVP